MSKKKVIYTAIFGGKDNLQNPTYVPEGFDFICFTDNPELTSSVWDIRFTEPLFQDPVRNARYHKIMTHKVLPEYDQSVWIDGNMVVEGDAGDLVTKYLSQTNFATYDHSKQKRRLWNFFWVRDKKFARDCIYDESQDLLQKTQNGFYMDDPALIKSQIARYKKENYPKHNGLAVTMIILRNHNHPEVIKNMEAWWEEIKNGSRRDQLSFNYIAWKNDFNFQYVKGDPRYNKYFSKVKHKNKNNYRG